jgi:hypothetical protein
VSSKNQQNPWTKSDKTAKIGGEGCEGVHYIKIQTEQNNLILRFLREHSPDVTEVQSYKIET